DGRVISVSEKLVKRFPVAFNDCSVCQLVVDEGKSVSTTLLEEMSSSWIGHRVKASTGRVLRAFLLTLRIRSRGRDPREEGKEVSWFSCSSKLSRPPSSE